MSALSQKRTLNSSLICRGKLFELAGLPRLIEKCLLGTTEPQDDAPTLAWPRLHPVGFLSERRFGTEVDIHGRVRICHDAQRCARKTRRCRACFACGRDINATCSLPAPGKMQTAL